MDTTDIEEWEEEHPILAKLLRWITHPVSALLLWLMEHGY